MVLVQEWPPANERVNLNPIQNVIIEVMNIKF